MRYRNTKTGVIIDIKGHISGQWEPVEPPQAPQPEAEKPKKAKKTPAQKKDTKK